MKNITYKALFYVFLFIAQSVISQENQYSYLSIPAALKENANAIVRLNTTEIDVIAVDEMIIKEVRVVTVLNKLGNRSVGAYVGYDNNSRITKLSARVYDALGNEIKKITKKKFLDVSAVDGGTLYSDSRVKYLDYTPINYPYTVKFEYVKKTSSTGFLPNWNPVEGYLVGIEKSSYRLNLNAGKARVKEFHFDGLDIEKSVSDTNIYYAIKNYKAIKPELFSPSLNDYKPKTLVALNNFKTDGVKGYYTNWNEFGKWMNNSLLFGRNSIDEGTKTKVLDLVKGVEDPIEKARIVYKFMQDKTRYISVQVGIGGIQPIPANEVDNVGYGDCKGLTNYTKALLDLVGVTSYYSHIEANEYEPVSFDKDFASLEQGNHIILNLPTKNGKDIWLECTSQIIPFGYLGNFTDDRDALVITPEGGVIKRTTSYKNEDNLQKMVADITLDEKGNVRANVTIKSYGIQYGSKYDLETYNFKEQKKYYKSSLWRYNNNLSIDKIVFKNDKKKIEFTEELTTSIKDFASISGDKLLLRVNVFNRNANTPKRYRNRKLPLKIRRGYMDVDEFTITIPKNYSVDGALFAERKIENKFGKYSIAIEKTAEDKLLYKRTLLIKDGLYKKEDYKNYRSFRRKVSRSDNLKIALTKK